jgi:hypothetical protein
VAPTSFRLYFSANSIAFHLRRCSFDSPLSGASSGMVIDPAGSSKSKKAIEKWLRLLQAGIVPITYYSDVSQNLLEDQGASSASMQPLVSKPQAPQRPKPHAVRGY